MVMESPDAGTGAADIFGAADADADADGLATPQPEVVSVIEAGWTLSRKSTFETLPVQPPSKGMYVLPVISGSRLYQRRLNNRKAAQR